MCVGLIHSQGESRYFASGRIATFKAYATGRRTENRGIARKSFDFRSRFNPFGLQKLAALSNL
jgi:hypothetical protein